MKGSRILTAYAKLPDDGIPDGGIPDDGIPDGGMESKEPILVLKLLIKLPGGGDPDGGMESKDPLGAATVRAKKADIRAKVLIF